MVPSRSSQTISAEDQALLICINALPDVRTYCMYSRRQESVSTIERAGLCRWPKHAWTSLHLCGPAMDSRSSPPGLPHAPSELALLKLRLGCFRIWTKVRWSSHRDWSCVDCAVDVCFLCFTLLGLRRPTSDWIQEAQHMCCCEMVCLHAVGGTYSVVCTVLTADAGLRSPGKRLSYVQGPIIQPDGSYFLAHQPLMEPPPG